MSLITHAEVERLRHLSSRLREVRDLQKELPELTLDIVAFCSDFFAPQFVLAHEACGELADAEAFALTQFCYAAILAARFAEVSSSSEDVRSHVQPWLEYTPDQLDDIAGRFPSAREQRQ